VRAAIEALIAETVPVSDKAEFLAALANKGETPQEIAAFVLELRTHAVPVPIPPEMRNQELLDVVGTGGDRLSTFNISTTVALLAASAGIRVAKHGNRASTSPIGSADVIEALGLRHDPGPLEACAALQETGFAFFFAPKYHPCFKHIIPARKLCAERGRSTIFNFLGPLLNPAQPTAMLIGVPKPELCEPLAAVLQSIGVHRAMVVCGTVTDENLEKRFLDEISSLGPTCIAEFYQDKGLTASDLSPETFPIQQATLADLKGGDRELNAEIIRRILRGDERGPKRDAVLLNAAAALFVAGQAKSMLDGWAEAARLIDSGDAWKKFQQVQGAKSRAD